MAFYEPGQSSPPAGWTQDTNDPEGRWWYNPDPAIDINNMENWWQAPPPGFLPDPNSPGWWFDPTKNVAQDQSAWWHDSTIIDDPGSKALGYWKLEEIAVAAGVPASPNVTDNWPGICRAAGLWGIDHPLVLIGFLGTMMKETSSLYPVREAWWVWNVDQAAAIRYYQDTAKHAAYSGGWQYHGRGYVQTTHDYNYRTDEEQMAAKGVTVDLLGHPDLLLVPEYAAHAICIYFLTHGYPAEGMVQACQNREWGEVRKAVLGGYDPDGIAKLERADAVLTPLAKARGFLS